MSLPETHTAWKETISSAMASRDDLSWFALIDPCSDERLPGILWKLDGNPNVLPLFMNTMRHEVSLSGPLFVPLTLGSSTAEWFLSESEFSPLGCLYAVETAQRDVLFEHLQNLLECTLKNEKKGIFRFFDPRVLFAIAQYPDDVWIRYVLGQANTVYAWEPGYCKAVVYADSGNVLDEPGIPLESELLREISNHTIPYAVIKNTVGDQGDKLRSMNMIDSYMFVKRICESIFSLDFRYIKDCIIATSLAMSAQHNIFEDENIRKILIEKKGNQDLSEILHEIPKEYFSSTT